MEIDLQQASKRLVSLSVEDRIRWAVDQFGDGVVLLSSMQKTASVLMHLFYTLKLTSEIIFVDTGFHFRETLMMRDTFMRRYKLNLVTLYPERTPEQQETRYGYKLHLFVDGQPECCQMRKTDPFVSYVLENKRKLVMIGLRRTEGGSRKEVQPIVEDSRIGGYSLHPIFDWSDEQLSQYLETHDVPIHPLHAQDYPSIGCQCCTTQVRPGEDPRAGRWRHLREPGEEGPRYCGINFSDGAGI